MLESLTSLTTVPSFCEVFAWKYGCFTRKTMNIINIFEMLLSSEKKNLVQEREQPQTI